MDQESQALEEIKPTVEQLFRSFILTESKPDVAGCIKIATNKLKTKFGNYQPLTKQKQISEHDSKQNTSECPSELWYKLQSITMAFS